jgi:hypothetical protein
MIAPRMESACIAALDFVDPADKLKAMAMDRAARAGVSVYEMGSGGYAVGWSAREVPDLRSLQRVLTQMGAAA